MNQQFFTSTRVQIGLAVLLVLSACIAIVVFGQQAIESSSWDHVTSDDNTDVEFSLRKHLIVSSNPQADLVRALNSKQLSLSMAARRVLDDQIKTWESVEAELFQADALELMQELSSNIESFGPSTQAYVVDRSTTLMSWRFSFSPQQQMKYTMYGETILRAVPTQETPETELQRLTAEYIAQRDLQESTLDSSIPSILTQDTVPPLYGGNLGVSPPAIVPRIPEPPSVTSLPAALPDPTIESSPLPLPVDDTNSGLRKITTTPVMSPTPPGPPQLLTDEQLPQVPQDISRWPTINVMHLLNDSREAVIQQAEQELSQRNFEQRELELAYRAVDPDLQTRLQFVIDLPTIAGANPRFWLNLLRKDQDKDVRSAATSVLLSSTAPSMQR
ncbi:MAG: hypothetical protein COA78_07565 [Blastopirellula sp.]|nr:MAG: hypothetical protein COA78_07565 [Blastopirellula sp.]